MEAVGFQVSCLKWLVPIKPTFWPPARVFGDRNTRELAPKIAATLVVETRTCNPRWIVTYETELVAREH